MRPACLPKIDVPLSVRKPCATKSQGMEFRRTWSGQFLFGAGTTTCTALVRRCIATGADTKSWQQSRVSKSRTHHVVVDEAGNSQPLYDDSFDEVLPFHPPGLAPVRRGNTAWHIGPDGTRAYAQSFSRVFGFYQGRAAVETEGHSHHIVISGEELYPERFDWCGNYQGGFCPVRSQDGSYFHLNLEGQAAYHERWNYAGDYREGSAVVHRDGRATHVDRAGNLLHGKWFQDLDVFHKGLARARDSDGWMHIDELGHPKYHRRFQAVEPFYNGQARVQCWNGSWQVINELAETVFEIASAREVDAFAAVSADLVGFWKTQTLRAAVELGLFEALPGSLESVAAATQLRPERLKRLLRALMELGVVELDQCGFIATKRGQLLCEEHPWTLADAAREYGRELGDMWAKLPQRLRGEDRCPEVFLEVVASPDRCQKHHRMLRSYARHDYFEVPKLLQLDPGNVVLDVGAGTGALGTLILQENPKVKVILLDFPQVLEQVTVVEGLELCPTDLQSDWSQEVPPADIILMGRILHDFYDDAALRILKTVHRALKPNGQIVIIEFLLPEGRASGGLCDLHLLAVTGGQERTQKELETLLGAAGFTSACQVHRLSSLPSVLLAKKSGGS